MPSFRIIVFPKSDASKAKIEQIINNQTLSDMRNCTFPNGKKNYAMNKTRLKKGRRLLSLMLFCFAFFGMAKADVIEIGSGTATNPIFPAYEYYNYSLSQQIYSYEEIGLAGTIDSISFYTTGSLTRNLDVYMVHTTKEAFTSSTDWIPVTGNNLVFSGSVTYTADGWTTIPLTTPFVYDGTSNLVLVVDDNTGSWSNSTVAKYVFNSDDNCSIFIYNDHTNFNPFTISNIGHTYNIKNRLKLNITPSGSSCRIPSNLMVTNTTATTTTLTWTNNSSANNWEILYYPENGGQDSIIATTNPFTLTGLTSNVRYYARVRALCGENDQSNWSRPVSFSPADFYTVTVSANPALGGEIRGGGQYSYGDTCTLRAMENSGYFFYNWTKDSTMVGDYYNPEYTFTVKDNASLVANFEQEEYYLDIVANPYWGGTATVVDTTSVFHYGDTVTIIATPYEGYLFLNWTIEMGGEQPRRTEIVLSTETTYTFVMDSSFFGLFEYGYYGEGCAIVANFKAECSRPTRFATTDLGPTLATFSWIENGTSESWYIFYQPLGTTMYIPYSSVEVNEIPYTLTDLQTSTTYQAFVVPYCGVMDTILNDTLISDTIVFTTLDACPIPQHVSVGNITGTTATATWVDYSDSYQVQLGVPAFAISTYFDNGIPEDWDNPTPVDSIYMDSIYMDSISSYYPWIVVDGHMQNSNMGRDNTTSSISVTVNFPIDGSIEFDAECIGEGTDPIYDAGIFLIDTTELFRIGFNTTGWNHYNYSVTAGTHTFTWAYSKDGSVSTDDGDYFAVDNVLMKAGDISWNNPLAVEDPQYTFTGLTPNTAYCVSVQGICDEVQTNWSDPVYFTTTESDTTTVTITASANPANGGTVSGYGEFSIGDTCTLIATANTGYTFNNWEKNNVVVSDSTSYTFTVTADAEYVANFQLNTYTITVTANPTNGGTVSGGGTYNHGQQATLTASANEGYTFTGWSDG